jgi:hypothetical protein
MTSLPDRASADRTLHDTLARAARRLRALRLLQAALRGLLVALLAPLGLLLWHLAWGVPQGVAPWVLGGAGAGLGVFLVVRLFERRSLAQAAAVLDREGDLHNELTTAEWFVRARSSSDWIDEQVTRASRTASGLEVEALVPLRVSRPLVGRVAAMLAVLAVLSLVPTTWTRGWLEVSASQGTLTAEELQKIEEIRALIEQADDLTPAERERLRELLAKLSRNDLTLEEVLATLEEAEAILEKKDEALEGQAADDEKADAEPDEAAPKEAGEPKPADEPTEPADPSEPSGEGEPTAREQATEEVKELEQAVAQRMEEAKQQAEQQGQQQQQADQESQSAESQQSGEKSEKSAEQGAQSQESAENQAGQQSPDDSAKGDLASAPKDKQGQIGEATELDVTLKKEALVQPPEPETLTPKELIDKDTKAGTSEVDYRDVTSRTPYADAEPVGSHEIPWSYRELVKSYFQAVGPRGKQ